MAWPVKTAAMLAAIDASVRSLDEKGGRVVMQAELEKKVRQKLP